MTKVYLFYSDGFELKNRVNILILKPFVGLYRGVAATMVFVSRVSGLSRNEDVVVDAIDISFSCTKISACGERSKPGTFKKTSCTWNARAN